MPTATTDHVGNDGFHDSFQENYDDRNLPPIEQEKLEETMVMVGNLSEALESEKRCPDEGTLHTGSLSDDHSMTVRKEMEIFYREREELNQKCNSLEKELEETRRDSDLWKLKTTMAMGSMRSRINSLEEDNACLVEKYEDVCRKLETVTMKRANVDLSI